MLPRLVRALRGGRARRWLSSLLIAGPLHCRVSRRQTSIHLPVNLHKRVRKYAFDQEIALSAVMVDAIRHGLTRERGRVTALTSNAHRAFPRLVVTSQRRRERGTEPALVCRSPAHRAHVESRISQN